MKQILLFFFLILNAFCYAEEVYIDGVEYTISMDEASITGHDSSFSGDLNVDSISHNDKKYPVTSVGNSAFEKCYGLTSVNLPLVSSIENKAFFRCYDLASVSLPIVSNLGDEAFNYCSSLTSVTLPNVAPTIQEHTFIKANNVKINIFTTSLDISGYTSENGYGNISSIGYYYDKDPNYIFSLSFSDNEKQANLIAVKETAKSDLNIVDRKEVIFEGSSYPITKVCHKAFSDCKALTMVSLPSASFIEAEAFSECSDLTDVNLPMATYIGLDAFYICNSLTNINVPLASYIGGDAFYECSSLTSISLPMAKSIKSRTFCECASLTNVNLPMAEDIEDMAFYWCDTLTSVSMPLVKSIGEDVFHQCSSLTSVSLPMASSIGQSAFSSCYSLKNVDLPLVTYIKLATFFQCSSLTNVNIPLAENIGMAAFAQCTSLTNISLPIASNIYDQAFEECTALSSVSLPMVQYISDDVFGYCHSLKNIYLPSIAPEFSTNRIPTSTKLNISIFVPKEHSGYTSEDSWSGFKYIGPLFVDIENINYYIDNVSKTAAILGVSDKSLSETTIKSYINYEEETYSVIFDEEELIFEGCDNLTKLTMPAEAIAISPYTFSGIDKSKISIYVEASEEEAEGYTAENGYEGFKEIIYAASATGIAPNEALEIKAFVDEYGSLHLYGINDSSEISIYNSTGSLIAKSNISDLDVQLKTGVYFVRVGSKTIKVIAK